MYAFLRNDHACSGIFGDVDIDADWRSLQRRYKAHSLTKGKGKHKLVCFLDNQSVPSPGHSG